MALLNMSPLIDATVRYERSSVRPVISKRRRWRQEKRDNMLNKQSTSAPIPVNTFSHSPAISEIQNNSSMQKANEFISNRMETIESQWHNAGGDEASDESILMMFTQNNLSILSTVSKDPTLQAGIRALLDESQ